MTITLANYNDTIIYAFKKILSFARNNYYIFLARFVWWIPITIGLFQGLTIYIENLQIQSNIITNDNFEDSSNPEAPSANSEDTRQNQILRNCEHYLLTIRGEAEGPYSESSKALTSRTKQPVKSST